MNRYDALKAPNPQQWLAAVEQHRINLVEDFHRRERIDLPNAQIHAVVHVIVENQIALAEDVPVRTLKRLQQEGLDRHDAIHAMAMVMMEYLPGILTAEPANTAGIGDPGNSFFEALEKLTADSWRHSMDDEEN